MTKAELKAAIDASGGARQKNAKEWDEAFAQYNAANPNRKLKRGSCGSCYRNVYEWLSK